MDVRAGLFLPLATLAAHPLHRKALQAAAAALLWGRAPRFAGACLL